MIGWKHWARDLDFEMLAIVFVVVVVVDIDVVICFDAGEFLGWRQWRRNPRL